MARLAINEAMNELNRRMKELRKEVDLEQQRIIDQIALLESRAPEVNVDMTGLEARMGDLLEAVKGSKPVDRTAEIMQALTNVQPGEGGGGFQYERDNTGRIRIMQGNGEWGPWFSLMGGGGGGPRVVGINPNQNTVTIDDGGNSITVDGTVSIDSLPDVVIDDSTPIDVNVATDATLVAEDSAHSSGDLGRNVYGVRNDSDTVFTDTDLDYSPISTDSAGAIKVVNGATPISIITDNSTSLSVKSEQPGIPGTVVADSRWSATVQGDITLGAISVVSPVAGVNERIVVDWWNFNVGVAVGIGSGLLTPTITIEETTSGTDLWCQSSIVGTTLANLFGNSQGPPVLIGAVNDSVTFIHPQATIALLTIGVCLNFGGYIIDVS